MATLYRPRRAHVPRLSAVGCRRPLLRRAGGDGVLELQGDHADTAIAWLAARGVASTRVGG